MTSLAFTVLRAGSPAETITLPAPLTVVAGYTGRDRHAVQEHIDELAAIGVYPPAEVPMFYPVDVGGLTSDREITVHGELTSGEVEPLYVRHDGRYYLGLASDHTDRELERTDIGDSKRACPTPVAASLVPIDDLDALSLDDAVVLSWVDGELYQQGSLRSLLRPADLVRVFQERSSPGAADFCLLGGTIPLLHGAFRYGRTWRIHLSLSGGSTIEHTYSVRIDTMKGSVQ